MARSRRVARLALIGTIAMCLVDHGFDGPRATGDELSGSKKDQTIPRTDEAPDARYFPRGRHACKAYGGLMLPLGDGVVDISDDDEGNVVLVVEAGKKSYSVKFREDLSECRFLDRVTLQSSTGFKPESGGALGARTSRTWSTDRYMVIVGILEKEPVHVVYLRDRATNDPLIVAKFPQRK